MPILVKVNCELNGSSELRMYLFSECNVVDETSYEKKAKNIYERLPERKGENVNG